MSLGAGELQMLYDLHGKHFDHLMNIGLRFGRSREDIKDIINQMFLDFIDQQVQLNTISNHKAYLSISFRRRLIDIDRENKKQQQILDMITPDAAYEPGMDEKSDNAQDIVDRAKKIKLLYEKLPPRCQKVIQLKFYEGLTTEQIAKKTGLSVRSVYNNLFEALKLLRIDILHVQAAQRKSLSSLFFIICLLFAGK
ncbi:sigma-70 family RNA polymerase sigma factor [Agriterribacter sp.]|uniref:RNA polymerase sigma factor n=1 Tax=Agriterribacter sp. TaxID=2821509 RepID=UPI002D097A1F|nr:sigma-70 family RNA polymerase sigma factor [Agriterribacter sp.]HTN07730.1 sigma-70 family RNA polymerase sigma factor [Agriterribacter sp.]